MSGTSARESYRSSKRTRPSDSQPSRMTPPVLFRLPSVPIPGHDSVAAASNINSAAMAISMATSASSASAGSVASVAAVPAQSASAPAQSAAATISGEKASGQRLLNILIVVLLLAALAVITWISLRRGNVAPSLADNKVGNDAALSTLGELKMPEMAGQTSQTTPNPASTKVDEHMSGLNVDEIKPSNPAELSLIDLPDSPNASAKDQSNDAESLLTGLDTSGTDSAFANAGTSSSSSNSSPTTTAQIQLRTPVPMGGSNITSLVDVPKPAGQLGESTFDSSNTARFETVSTPTQPAKIFPANTDSSPNATSTPNASAKTSNTGAADGSPSLWDGAQRPSLEGLQLSSKATGNASPTQVNISKPLTAEISMAANQPTVDTNNALVGDNSKQGTTVGAGESEPYNLAETLPERLPTAVDNLQKSRADLNPTMLARVAASGAAKSAVSNSASLPSGTTNKPINSYVGATNANTGGQNLYTNSYVNQAPTGNSAPINGYALQSHVPAGVTGSGPGPYVPPTTAMPGAVGQYSAGQQQLVSGPNSAPTMTASYAIAPRGNPTMNSQGFTQQQQQYHPQQPTAPTGYAQPGVQSGYAQPGYTQPGYTQPTAPPSGYGQPNAYGQPNPYGAAGSGYANPAYPTPSASAPAANAPGMSMPNAGYQRTASYPVNNPYPGGQTPVGLIGPAGNATPPSGDIAPIPVLGTGGVRNSTPYGSPQ